MKTEDLERLSHYGWVDRAAGIAHIPIDRAIDILAKRGLPVPAAVEPTPSASGKSKGPAAEKEQAMPDRGREQKP
jgi:hypothetical protein